MPSFMIAPPVPPQRSNRERGTIDDLQIGLFAFDEDEGLFVPAKEAIQEANAEIVALNPSVNYRITTADRLGQGSPRNKAHDNLRAIRILKRIQSDGRTATPDEQAALVRYVGWGGLPKVFEDSEGEWASIGDQLKNLLGSSGFASARESVTSSFYTPEAVIRGIYDLLAQLGFDGGNVLEPAAGVGHFIGLMPEGMADDTHWTAIELDTTSAGISQALYPEANVLACGFEDAFLSGDGFDLVLGNVPFGQDAPYDPIHNPERFSIHNYFFLRALAAVRPGGVVAMLTSRYTLDAENTAVRRTLSDQADLIGAIRLPEHTFQQAAGTRVVTDLILLRKREPRAKRVGPAWLETRKIDLSGAFYSVNEYFVAHPHMVVGDFAERSSQHGPVITVQAEADLDLRAEIARLADHLDSSDLFVHDERLPEPVGRLHPHDAVHGVQDGVFVVVDGELCIRQGNSLAPHGLKNAKDVARARALTGLREQYNAVIDAQSKDLGVDAEEEARAQLHVLYDAFTQRFGPINSEKRTVRRDGVVQVRKKNLAAFKKDPEWQKVAALEIYDVETDTAEKQAMFYRRVVRPRVEITECGTAMDALLVCLDQKGYVDLAHIGHLWQGCSEAEVTRALDGRIFLDPETMLWQTSDAYLSGKDIRAKLVAARDAATRDRQFEKNVAALEQVQPEDIPFSQIHVQLASGWIPTSYIEQFIRDLLGLIAKNAAIEIAYNELDAEWSIDVPSYLKTCVESTREWGTERAHAIRLIKDSLNQRITQIYDTVEVFDPKLQTTVEKTVKNPGATMDAQEKQQRIEEHFAEWIWSAPERATRLARSYNDRLNCIRLRDYDGSHLQMHGASDAITLDKHQKDGVWRILQEGNTLAAHVVGAGKTFMAVAAGMEMKRLGQATKPVYVVPNHLLEQWSREFLQLYPQANLLCADSDHFTGDTRRLFLARIAAGEYDGVLITESAFTRISVSAEFEKQYIDEELDRYEVMLCEAKATGKRLAVKQIEKARRTMRARLKQLANRRSKDTLLSFDQLGIDQVFFDEAHRVKNLFTASKITGIPKASKPSQRAQDMLMKAIWLDQRTPGRGLVFLTGTPVSNTISEVYVMLRFLAPRVLGAARMHHFDAWAAVFTKRTMSLEMAPDGGSYRLRVRFRFCNVAELVRMFRTVADVKTVEMLGLDRPELGGDPTQAGYDIVSAPASPDLKAHVASLVERAEAIRNGDVKPEEDNMLAITTAGRMGALDMRLIDPTLADWKESKVNRAVRNILRLYHETHDVRGTQLVFCDISTPKKDKFNVYDDVRQKLIAGLPEEGLVGIPAEEVRFVHEATNDIKKARLFKDMRDGRVRVMLASTERAGVGTNVQDRLCALHHLDAPWKPAEIEQREGRILRRGNLFKVVRIFRYVTEGSFDAYMWTTLQYKAEEISKVMVGEVTDIREIDDIGGQALSFNQVKAIASGNPEVIRKAQVDQEVIKLQRAKNAWKDRRILNAIDLAALPERIRSTETHLERTLSDLDQRVDTRGDLFAITLGGTRYTERPEAANALRRILMELGAQSWSRTTYPVGEFAGFDLEVEAMRDHYPEVRIVGSRTYGVKFALGQSNPAGNLQALEHLPRRLEREVEEVSAHLGYLKQQYDQLQSVGEEVFPKEAELQALLDEQRDLDRLLTQDDSKQNLSSLDEASATDEDDEPSMAEAA